MIDYFSIALTHALIALACWRLLGRADLDDPAAERAQDEGKAGAGGPVPAARRPWLKHQRGAAAAPQGERLG